MSFAGFLPSVVALPGSRRDNEPLRGEYLLMTVGNLYIKAQTATCGLSLLVSDDGRSRYSCLRFCFNPTKAKRNIHCLELPAKQT